MHILFKFCSGTHGLFKEFCKYANRVGHRNILVVGLVRSQWSMFFFSLHRTIPRDDCLDSCKQVLVPDGFEAFVCGSIFDNGILCLGVEQGMLFNNVLV